MPTLSKKWLQNLIHLIILGIIIATCYLLCVPKNTYHIGLIYLPNSKTTLAPTPIASFDPINYQPNSLGLAEDSYQTIGHIRIEQKAKGHTQETFNKQITPLLTEARTIAAKHGANALILNAAGQSSSADAPMTTVVLYATAIKK